MKTLLPVLALCLAALPAQIPGNVIGTTRAVQTSRIVRPDGGATAADYLNRLDPRDHLHCFDDGTGLMQVAGMELALHDANDLTTESWSAVWYDEDPGVPGTPHAAGFSVRIGPLPLPGPLNPGTPTSVTWYIGIGLGTPLAMTANQTVFYGIGLDPAPGAGYPLDGLSVLTTRDATGDPIHDQPGRAIGTLPQGTWSVWAPTQNGMATGYTWFGGTPGAREVLYCDLSGVGAGGTPIAVTNQASYPISNPGQGAIGQGGTTSPFSGLHPDVFGWNTGRQDDPGFLFLDQSMNGRFAVILAGFGGAAAPTPLAAVPGVDPGSYGVLCIDAAAATTFFALIDANGYAQVVLPFGPAARAFVQANPGLDLWWQGIALDVAGPQPLLHASGCARQHL